MAMSTFGKGFYLWRISACEQGNIKEIVDVAVRANLQHVLIKIADGIYSYNVDPKTKLDLCAPLVQAFKARNIDVWGWHYVYGMNPTQEASKAIERVKALELDGYVIDAEAEYKKPGRSLAARKFMADLRKGLPKTPIALSSYRYPTYHPQLPWKDFLDKCDYSMPQVYWIKARNAGEQLTRCVNEYQALTPYRPIIPTGAAFREGSWSPTAAQVDDFLDTAVKLNLAGASFWEWSNTRYYLPELWKLIGEYPWPGAPVEKDISQKLFDSLNNHNLEQVMSLYHPLALHVDEKQTIQGPQAIRNWYSGLFNQTLPGARYKLVDFDGTGSFRHLGWTADSTRRHVQDGSDTLGLAEGKIAYHYTFFTLS